MRDKNRRYCIEFYKSFNVIDGVTYEVNTLGSDGRCIPDQSLSIDSMITLGYEIAKRKRNVVTYSHFKIKSAPKGTHAFFNNESERQFINY